MQGNFSFLTNTFPALEKIGTLAENYLYSDPNSCLYKMGAFAETIAEWPTDSSVCKYGKADYALFAGQKLIGVIEAKAVHKDISSVIDNQCREYSMGIRAEHESYLVDTWGAYKVPFLFATNGRRYFKQMETKSGVWFRDARQDKPARPIGHL